VATGVCPADFQLGGSASANAETEQLRIHLVRMKLSSGRTFAAAAFTHFKVGNRARAVYCTAKARRRSEFAGDLIPKLANDQQRDDLRLELRDLREKLDRLRLLAG